MLPKSHIVLFSLSYILLSNLATESNELEVNFQNLILYVIFADDGNYIAVCHVA